MEPQPTRRCSGCRRDLGEVHFAPSVWRKGGYCRPCAAAYMRRYWVDNPQSKPGPMQRLPVHGPPVPAPLIACAWCGEQNEGRRYCGPGCVKTFHKRQRSKAEVDAGIAARRALPLKHPPPKNPHPVGAQCRYCTATVSRAGRVQCDECLANKANKREHRRRYRAAKASSSGEPYADYVIADAFAWKCQLCGKAIPKAAKYPDPRSLSIDHVLPVSLGGADDAANVQPAHLRCNLTKRNGVRPEGEQLRLCA